MEKLIEVTKKLSRRPEIIRVKNQLLQGITWLVQRPWLVVNGGLIITVALTACIFKIKIDNDIKNFFEPENPHRAFYEYINEVFGNSDILFIGIETDDIYSQKIVDYVKNITRNIEELNQIQPVKNIANYLNITQDEAGQVIQAINEKETSGKEELWKIFTDPQRLAGEFFWDEDFARKVASGVSAGTIDELMNYYYLPINKVVSFTTIPFIKGEGNSISVETLYPQNERPDDALRILKERAQSWDMYQGTMFSYDGTMTSIMVQQQVIELSVREEINLKIQKMAREMKPEGCTVYVSGLPVIADSITQQMYSDLFRLLPIVFLVVLASLIISFRHLEGVVIPFIAIAVSILWTVGVMALLNIPLNLVSMNVPVLLTAVASAYGIHFMNHYYIHPGTDRSKVIVDTLFKVGKPIIIAGLTTAAGFGSLVTSDFLHIRNLGIVSSIGVFFALCISITLIPAILLINNKPKPMVIFSKSEGKKRDITQFLLDFSYTVVDKYPAVVVAVVAVIIGISAWGITRLEVNMNDIAMFKEKSPLRVADTVLNEKLAGTQALDIVFEKQDAGDIIIPGVLSAINKFQDDIVKKFPEVRKTISINNYIKKINQEMNGGNPAFYIIPDSPEQIKIFFLLFSGNLKDYITDKKDKLRVMIHIKRVPVNEIGKIINYINNYYDKDMLDKNNIRMTVSGGADIMYAGNEMIMRGQLWNIVSSFVAVTILIFMIFQTVKLTSIGLIPLFFALILNFGVMGLLNIPLNAATAMVSSLAIGIGIDYAVHFINHFKMLYENENFSLNEALMHTFMETGRAIIFNFVTVAAGFMVLLFSEFVLLIQFSILMSLSMITTGFGALILIPIALKKSHKNSRQIAV